MKFLMIPFLMIFLISCNVRGQEDKLIRNFITSCKDKNIELATVREQYICENKDNVDKKTALDKFIEDGISSIREEIQSKDLSKLSIVKASNDIKVQKEFLETDFSKIFVLKEKQKILFYFLIENDKITAFNVLNKGGIKVFIKLCN
ncbi:hypothetical protein SGQ44_14105 [Flavobacterium sp. Fl-77]|uniref:DUF4252 domain-containing protein n=1 Tax=Flavobacterium flavipigmentatum TaxID=2893884 RepID=A0AAJ2SIM6_9FLAO|nr:MULTISPECIES: hypothetical protein [unclassified Flavobacterium]MDX6182051.1 hypothetical protein [Flavobacterium sp. Fl-33]MDX6186894.1 hypothetical protein [Flavobacterium sp. Fl-77]UFH37028.1 hypothetical protein LNP22_09790 [Flavobacterium sp. F-70]